MKCYSVYEKKIDCSYFVVVLAPEAYARILLDTSPVFAICFISAMCRIMVFIKDER